MAEARQRAAWARTASLCCLIANANRDVRRKPSPFTADDFNPYARPQAAVPAGKTAFRMLKRMFVKGPDKGRKGSQP